MRYQKYARLTLILIMMLIVIIPSHVFSQALKTPLPQSVLDLLSNEISGQIIYNNEVLLAGAPWIRNDNEFTGTFYESQKIYDLVKSYGIETTRFERYESNRNFIYPKEGEFWLTKPENKLIARLEADPALIARGSVTSDVTGGLVYLPQLNREKINELKSSSEDSRYKGKIALMWSHARGTAAQALDAAGFAGVISFSSRDKYFDPNQVVYSRGSYSGMKNLKFGLTVSWRQWSELLEDIEKGRKPEVRCIIKMEEHKDKYETVFSWIPGTEPDKKGVIFTAHLFEGYTKRGANDNMSGCVVQLEILRALSRLIKEGKLPQPRRNIYFLWPNEISGTFEQIKQNPELMDKLSININMDMVGEGLRKNNSLFTMSECPNHLPSYLDGLSHSILNYVWRTNDIVYLPDSPRNRFGGNNFPKPMMEKNGSTDAFRFFIHKATGGSDHICFNNPAVRIPAIEFFTWPDQWYHADTDTPDKSDPTEMKRVGFIGAAIAYIAANCTDETLDGLLDAVSAFGYERVAKRELAKAMNDINNAVSSDLNKKVLAACNLIESGLERELGAFESVKEIFTGSSLAVNRVNNRIEEWNIYRNAVINQIFEYGKIKAKQMNVIAPERLKLTGDEKKYSKLFPSINKNVDRKIFRYNQSPGYKAYVDLNPGALRNTGLNRRAQRAVLNYVNGKRSVTSIKYLVSAEINSEIGLNGVVKYLEFMKNIGYVDF